MILRGCIINTVPDIRLGHYRVLVTNSETRDLQRMWCCAASYSQTRNKPGVVCVQGQEERAAEDAAGRAQARAKVPGEGGAAGCRILCWYNSQPSLSSCSDISPPGAPRSQSQPSDMSQELCGPIEVMSAMGLGM